MAPVGLPSKVGPSRPELQLPCFFWESKAWGTARDWHGGPVFPQPRLPWLTWNHMSQQGMASYPSW